MNPVSTPPVPDRADRLAGGLIGLLVGDAVGVPYEFNPPGRLPPRDCIDLVPPEDFARSHPDVLPGTWSDDGAQALCLLASLQHAGHLDLDDFSRRLVNWRDAGYLAVDYEVFDVGIQTNRAIANLRNGVPSHLAGPNGERDNGNGALMRVLPLALWHRGDDRELMELAARQSLPTHGHARSQVACAFACLWARAEFDGAADTWNRAAARLRELGPGVGLPLAEIEIVLDVQNAARVAGSGYVVDTLWSARQALDDGASFDAVVRAAFALGNDTDTTGAVAGGIAGIRYGLAGIPVAWRDALRGTELVAPMLSRLA